MNQPKSPSGLGYSFAPAEVEEATALSELFNRCAANDGTSERLSPESMTHELEALFSPLEERTTVARTSSGEIVGYTTAYYRPSEAQEQWSYLNVYVDPGHRNVGLEEIMLGWAEEAGTSILSTVNATKKYLSAWIDKRLEADAARLAERGYVEARHWWDMECILTEEIDTPATHGYEIVPWEDHHHDPARLIYNSAFADHWGSVPMDAATWLKIAINSPSFRQHYSFVAVANDEIVGYAANEDYPEDWEAAGRREAWIGGLGVLRDWRKQGIATALLAHSMASMKRNGFDAAMIGVDSASPTGAQHLYTSLGFTTKDTGTTWQRELS